MNLKQTLFIICFCVTVAHAAGDPKAGEQKSVVCGACHGPQGQSFNPEWPHLAGQHPSYFIKQLHDFKQSETRSAPTMTPMTFQLSDQDIEDLAAYYSIQPQKNQKTTPHALTKGEILYRQGDIQKHITACIACHGPDGLGNDQARFPMIRHQHAIYTIQQLEAFKTKKRHNDLNAIMQDICSHLDKEDMEAIANYLEKM